MDTIGVITDDKTNIFVPNLNIRLPAELYRTHAEPISEAQNGVTNYQNRLKIGVWLLYDPIKRFKPFAWRSEDVADLPTPQKSQIAHSGTTQL